MNKDRAKITVKFGQAEDKTPASLKPVPVALKGPVEEEYEPLPIEKVSLSPTVEEIAVSMDTSVEDDSYGPKYVPSILPKQGLVTKRRRKAITRGKAIAVGCSIIGAVAVGLVFGSIALNFFKSGSFGQVQGGSHATGSLKKTDQKTATPPAAESNAAATAANSESSKAAGTSKTPITLAASSYFVVQAGVFQEQANAASMLEKIKSHGWPNALIGDKPQYLLLGMAVNRDNALALANQYKDLSVFIKEFKEDARTVSIPLKDGAKTSQEEWDQWFQKESDFIKTVGGAIGQGLSSGKLGDDTLQNVTNAHRSLLEKGRDMVGKLPDPDQEQGNRLLNDYTKIVTALQQYQKQPSDGLIWQAEQGLLDAWQSKKQLFSNFK